MRTRLQYFLNVVGERDTISILLMVGLADARFVCSCVSQQFGMVLVPSCTRALRAYCKVRTRLQDFLNVVDERDTISILLLMGPG